MSKLKIGFFALLSGLSLVTLCAQSVPPLVNYQGRLANPDGSLFPTADYELRFRIWDATNNGVLVWGPQVFDGGIGLGHGAKVPVVQGYFNVVLGPVDTNGNSLIGAFGGSNRFVEVTVSNRPPVLPRQQILSTPYALTAGSLIRELQEALCPPGTITAFGGHPNRIPAGWLLCDGRAVSSGVFPRLHFAVSTNWGAGIPSGTNDFSLPDLRGLFLRGVNGTRTNFTQTTTNSVDPDFLLRTNGLLGGNSGNMAGSLQMDAFKRHQHNMRGGYSGEPLGSFSSTYPVAGVYGSGSFWAEGEDETRPKNAYVHYIIKY